MKIDLWSRQRYSPIQEDDSVSLGSPASRSVFRQPVPLYLVICLLAAQSVLWLTSIAYLLSQNGSRMTLPLDSSFRDGLGNSFPAAAALKYEIKVFGEDHKYMSLHGVPSHQTDYAWFALMGSSEGMIQATREDGFDIDRLPQSIEAQSHSGLYVYGVEAHHQLHCLNRIRMSFHPQHYFPNETETEIVHHREHCLDHLRQSVMCSGDFALDRWVRDPVDNRTWLKTDVPHVCRDYGALQQWQESFRLRTMVD